MTDAHCHVSAGDPAVRELLVGRDVLGVHPWAVLADPVAAAAAVAALPDQLAAAPAAAVGEIGLDRLKERAIPGVMRELFERQLQLAAEYHRPVVLHGAKCWGEVVRACRPHVGKIPAILFHGFSRSAGLVPEIAAMPGFISVGPAVLNPHAVNYRRLVATLPDSVLLLETDRTPESAATCPPIAAIAAEVAALRHCSLPDLLTQLSTNFYSLLSNL